MQEVSVLLMAVPMIGAVVGLAALMLAPRRAAMLAGLVLFILLAVGAGLVWNAEQHASKTRIVAARAQALEMQALAPGSIFPCLSGAGSRELREACERVLFNSPHAIAAAVDFTEAQVDLLIEGVPLAANKLSAEQAIGRIRRRLGRDQFGIVAYVLATRYGCTADRCDHLSRLGMPISIQADLRQGTFQRHIDRYVSSAPATTIRTSHSAPNTAIIDPRPVGRGMPPTRFRPLSERYSLPSAASIPPVSIMIDEPPEPGRSEPISAQRTSDQPAARVPTQPSARDGARIRPAPTQAPLSLGSR